MFGTFISGRAENNICKDGKVHKKNGRKQLICVIIGFWTGLILTGLFVSHRAQAVDAQIARIQTGLSDEVFRFHVLADSDSGDAQRVKLKVRDRVLAYMEAEMKADGALLSAERAKAWAGAHLERIEALCGEVIQDEGFSYGATAEIVTCYFPEKRYGDVTFPQGRYEALRIRLGRAKGHNWWCVLYPNLCFIDAACTAVSEEGKDGLEEALSQEEYEFVTAASQFKIRTFFFGADEDRLP